MCSVQAAEMWQKSELKISQNMFRFNKKRVQQQENKQKRGAEGVYEGVSIERRRRDEPRRMREQRGASIIQQLWIMGRQAEADHSWRCCIRSRGKPSRSEEFTCRKSFPHEWRPFVPTHSNAAHRRRNTRIRIALIDSSWCRPDQISRQTDSVSLMWWRKTYVEENQQKTIKFNESWGWSSN